MKSLLKTVSAALIALTIISVQPARAQIKIFFGDLLNGAVNGLALGGATMALQNSDDWAPLRVGLGVGILYGAGVGVYDVSRVPKAQQLYISGTFNSGNNSTIIVLLDTFYGAAAGAALGAAVSLISGNAILDGLQYGSGAGAWIGFGFGLIDSFILAQGPEDLMASLKSPSPSINGLIRYCPPSSDLKVGLIHPTMMTQPVFKGQALQAKYAFGVEVVNLRIDF